MFLNCFEQLKKKLQRKGRFTLFFASNFFFKKKFYLPEAARRAAARFWHELHPPAPGACGRAACAALACAAAMRACAAAALALLMAEELLFGFIFLWSEKYQISGTQ